MAGALRSTLTRHDGQEDFSITTQDQMLEVLGSILGILTLAVGAPGSALRLGALLLIPLLRRGILGLGLILILGLGLGLGLTGSVLPALLRYALLDGVALGLIGLAPGLPVLFEQPAPPLALGLQFGTTALALRRQLLPAGLVVLPGLGLAGLVSRPGGWFGCRGSREAPEEAEQEN